MKSKCCQAEAISRPGVPDFKGGRFFKVEGIEETMTQMFVCSKCGNPCDIVLEDREDPKTIIENAIRKFTEDQDNQANLASDAAQKSIVEAILEALKENEFLIVHAAQSGPFLRINPLKEIRKPS